MSAYTYVMPTNNCANIYMSEYMCKVDVVNVGKGDLCEHTCSLMAQVIYVSIHNLCWNTNTMMA